MTILKLTIAGALCLSFGLDPAQAGGFRTLTQVAQMQARAADAIAARPVTPMLSPEGTSGGTA